MKLDPHIHSCYSGDARTKPQDILKHAKRVGLDIIAISDHDTLKGSEIAIEEAKNNDYDILVVPSIEISSNKGHILGFGIDEAVSKDLSPEETIDKIHDFGGIAIIPHPYSFYRNGLFSKDKTLAKQLEIEGVETKNARYIIGYSNHATKKLAKKRNLAEIGASDSHFLGSIGNCYTELPTLENEVSVDDIIKSIKSKDTIAKGSRTSNYLIAKEVFNKKIRRIY